ncbi:hypothetical protein HYV69_01905 [Candidatus Uhrbacteria bacterium]|nr:hypothetical protein [Candidatus Uhrbacteria bacterium]
MLPLFAIPIVQQAVQTSAVAVPFFERPIDVILFNFFIWFGWIPIAITLGWGFVMMWQNYRQGEWSKTLKFVLLAIDVPSMTEQTPKALENLFSSLYGSKSTLTWKETWIVGKYHPSFSFEIISAEGYIQFLVRTQTRFRDMIEAGIYAHYPDAEISEVEDYSTKFPNVYPDNEYEMWGGEFKLAKPSMYPIRTYIEFEDKVTGEIKDPLGHTLEQLAKMRPGEHFWFQMIVQPSTNDWIKEGIARLNKLYGKTEQAKKSAIVSAIDSVVSWPIGVVANATGTDLGGLFGITTEETKKEPYVLLPLQETKEADALYRKLSKVGMGTKIRILYVAKKNAFVKVERTGMVKGILNQYADLALNKFELFIPQVPKDDYFWMRWVYTKKQHTLMKAYQNRSWGIGADPSFLNVEEIASLWHFPTFGFKAPLVKKAEARRAEPPVGLPITFEEETLAVGREEKEEMEGMNKTEGKEEDAEATGFNQRETKIEDTIGSAEVPDVKPPTSPVKEKPLTQSDDFVPPNLPV